MARAPQVRSSRPLPGQDMPFRQFLVLRRRNTLVARYSEEGFAELAAYLRERLPGYSGHLNIASLPSLYWLKERRELVRRLVIGLGFETKEEVEKFREIVSARGKGEDIVGAGCDLPIDDADYFCPANPEQVSFRLRSDANRLIRAHLLPPASNGRVNVVVVDRGVDPNLIGANFEGGWPHPSGSPGAGQAVRGHGAMTTRNVLAVAGTARIWDIPLIPERITDKKTFLAEALVAYSVALAEIALNAGQQRFSGSWIFVNPWALFDRKGEVPAGDYTNNPWHPFNVVISVANLLRHDVVFSAGNCGQFCPDWRCGPTDRGSGASILGANSHHRVLTVGAARVDDLWLGYSSQGPSQPGFNVLGPNQKPDLCAPSNFCEDNDAHAVNSGTSAACAVAAGVVARLRTRSQWAAGNLRPGVIRNVLRSRARKLGVTAPNNETGFGMFDAKSTYDDLLANFP
jgi:hypothetical protein